MIIGVPSEGKRSHMVQRGVRAGQPTGACPILSDEAPRPKHIIKALTYVFRAGMLVAVETEHVRSPVNQPFPTRGYSGEASALQTCGRRPTSGIPTSSCSLWVNGLGLWWAAAGLTFFGLLTATPAPAQSNSAPQILFLHLRITNEVVSLVSSVARPGVLKAPREAAGDDLRYELLSASRKSLWKAGVADPTIRRLEYEEPPGSGNLKHKTLVLKEAEFTIRVPVLAEARRIDFYRLEPSGAPDAEGRRAVTRRSLGSLTLP